MVNHPLVKRLGAAVCTLVVALSGCGPGADVLEGDVADAVIDAAPGGEIEPGTTTPIGPARPPSGSPVSLPVTSTQPPVQADLRFPSPPRSCSEVFTDQQLGGGLDDAIAAMTIDHGELYLAGHTGRIPALFRIDAWGHTRSVKGFDSAGMSRIDDVIVHAKDVVIAGQTQVSADAFVAVIQHGDTGVQQFLQVGGSEPEAVQQLASDSRGAWMLAGFLGQDNTEPMFALGDLPLSGSKVSLTGIHVERTESVDRYVGIAPTYDGTDDVFVVGERRRDPARGVFVRRLTRAGVIKWEQNVAAGEDDRAGKMVSLRNGDLVVTGSTGLGLKKHYGRMDAFIAQLDGGNGRIVHFGQAGTANDDFATDVFVDGQGHAFIAGHSVVWNTAGERSTDAFVHEFDLAGNWLHQWYGSTAGRDEATAVVRDECDRTFVAGLTEGPLAGQHLGGIDGFVMQITMDPATP